MRIVVINHMTLDGVAQAPRGRTKIVTTGARAFAKLHLVETTTTPTGVIIATYRSA
jgi:hypothetical protein